MNFKLPHTHHTHTHTHTHVTLTSSDVTHTHTLTSSVVAHMHAHTHTHQLWCRGVHAVPEAVVEAGPVRRTSSAAAWCGSAWMSPPHVGGHPRCYDISHASGYQAHCPSHLLPLLRTSHALPRSLHWACMPCAVLQSLPHSRTDSQGVGLAGVPRPLLHTQQPAAAAVVCWCRPCPHPGFHTLRGISCLGNKGIHGGGRVPSWGRVPGVWRSSHVGVACAPWGCQERAWPQEGSAGVAEKRCG